MKQTLIAFLALILVVSMMAIPAQAATEDEIEASIAKGVAWLAGQQDLTGSPDPLDPDYNPNYGSWPGWYRVGSTGLAVLKLEDRGNDLAEDDPNIDGPFDPDYAYSQNVIDGLNYIFSMAMIFGDLDPQAGEDPDTDSDGLGVYFGGIYETSIAMMAIAGSEKPTFTVSGGACNGWTYKAVLQDAVDYMAYSQADPPALDAGGWFYDPRDNIGGSDNSNGGYASLSLGYAQVAPFSCNVPGWVLTRLSSYCDWIQNDQGEDYVGDPNTPDYDGGSGYSDPTDWVNVLKTGNLLYQMNLTSDDKETPRVIDALDYLERHWADNADPGWRPNHYQAMYTIMKGLESMVIITFGDPEIDWYAEFAQVIVSQQNDDGSWPICPCYCSDDWCNDCDQILCTTWALLTLERVIPNRPPIADAGPDQTVEQTSYDGAVATLDGTKSYDPDEDPITYKWTAFGLVFDDPTIPEPTATFPLGTTTVTLKVFDGEYSDSDTVDITVVDTTPPVVDAGEDVTVEQTSYEGAPAELPTPEVSDICDPEPEVVVSGAMDIYPLGDTEVTVTATDASGNSASDIIVVHVVDTTPPTLSCVESVNPHGKNIPGENRTKKGDKPGKNPDGFYEICVEDICDEFPVMYVGTEEFIVGESDTEDFFALEGCVVIKFTEAPGAAPSCKKIGSSNGQAGAVTWHITLPTDPVITAVDLSGNTTVCYDCLVPPPPK